MTSYGVSNYAMPNLMPCIVIGFEGIKANDCNDHHVISIDVQCGGLSCNQRSAAGFVLRLAAAQEFARVDPWPLVRAFQDASDDRTWSDGLSDNVHFASDTSGEPLSPDLLAELDIVMARYFRLPPLAGGIEAFAHFDVVDVLSFFEDWPVWSLTPRDGSTECRYIEDYDYGSIADYVVEDVERFGRTHVERLQAMARDLAIDAPVRAYLIWGNSD